MNATGSTWTTVRQRVWFIVLACLMASVALALLFRSAASGPAQEQVAAATISLPARQTAPAIGVRFVPGESDLGPPRHTHSLVWGDIDGDGDLDLVVGNGVYWQDDIGGTRVTPLEEIDQRNQIYLNNGQGEFSVETITAGDGADALDTRAVAWGDWDGDGDLDLALANGGSRVGGQPNQVFENVDGVLRHDPEAGLGWTSPDANWSSSVAWGDWDGDGDLDLAVGNENAPNQVYEFITGTLQLSPTIGIGWQSSEAADEAMPTVAVAWGDWNNDTRLDLAVGNYGAPDQVFQNISGTLQLDPAAGIGWEAPTPAPTQTFASLTQALAWGDWDGDDDLDLAIGGGSRTKDVGSFLTVYENDGGRFLPEPAWQQLSEGPQQPYFDAYYKPASLVWGDYDNDGDLDLAVGNNAGEARGRKNRIYENDGSGLAFMPEQGVGWQSPLSQGRNGETTFAVAFGDADGDGDLDLAIGNGGVENGGQANWVFMNAAPVIGFSAAPELTEEARPSVSVAWGDWDGDEDLDLAVGNVGEPIQVYEFISGSLQFSPTIGIGWEAPVTNTANTSDVAWGDWDGDGDLDLAVGNDGAPDLVYENEGQGVSLRLDTANGLGWQSGLTDTTRTRSVAWGDWDQDGDLDLALGKRNEPAQVFENTGAGLLLAPADGLGWQSPEPVRAEGAAWGDWDGDGDLDLALGSSIFENENDTLTLDPPNRLGWEGGFTATDVAWANVDGSGTAELAIMTPGKARVYRRVRDTMLAYWQSRDFISPQSAAWGDVDGDQDLDLVVANADDDGFEPNMVFENINGRLSTEIRPAWQTTDLSADGDGFTQSYGVALGDVDADGDLDIAFANQCTSAACSSSGQPNSLYLNTYQQRAATLPALAVPLLEATDPDNTDGAYFYASPEIVSSSVISIPFKLVDPNETPVGRIEVSYSRDGEAWEEAIPTEETRTTNLSTSPDGTAHEFGWNIFGSDFFGRSDNVVIRFEVFQAPPSADVSPESFYRYVNGVSGSFQRPTVTATTFPFRVQSTQIRVVDEQGARPGALVYRLPADQVDQALLMPEPLQPQATDEKGVLSGGGALAPGDRLLALWPVPVSPVTFTNKARLFYTSAPITEDGPQLTTFEEPGTDPAGSIITLVISDNNPLLLFDLVVSLEWDASNDPTFQTELTNSFQRASELLYDVTNGQAALGEVHVYQSKELWPAADVVIKANNSIRPSAAIGGVAQVPMAETIISPTREITNAYGGGQIQMGTVWDPFGENTAELGDEWWRALAHELAHYLFFLPDNYLGVEDGVLRRIECQGSFMTSTYDPDFSEFLTGDAWQEDPDCQRSLAQITTGRSDWDTITEFYKMLDDRELEGPAILPLPVTTLFFWPDQDGRPTLRARNFDVRDGRPGQNNARLRLPGGQAYLFQTQGTDALDDDLVIQLGTPTGGGDRLKVRGAHAGDRLCLIDTSRSQAFIGCDPDLTATTVSITMTEMVAGWEPRIEAAAVTSRTLAISVTQPVSSGEQLNVQVFPLHYWSVPNFANLSPTATMTVSDDLHTATLTMSLPAYEVAIRVWADEEPLRESMTHLRLNPPWWTPPEGAEPPPGTITPPHAFGVGGPTSNGLYDPNSFSVAGPNAIGIGGPNAIGIGGPNAIGIGGPNAIGIGGPNAIGIGGPNAIGIGGPNAIGIGGPNAIGIGGPNAIGIGGPNAIGIGGPNAIGIGGPNAISIGGPNAIGIGGPNAIGIGGSNSVSANAPILSADAQVVIYSKRGFFEDNGVETLQLLGSAPSRDDQGWLTPVGQAYQVALTEGITDPRNIAINYLQRDVPPGYEHTLNVYFLPDGSTEWERLPTSRFTENLAVADLQPVDGIYSIMSTIQMPALIPGWNQFAYPLPEPRSVTETLASVAGAYSIVYEGLRPESEPGALPTTNVEAFEFGRSYWVWIHGDEAVTPYIAPSLPSPDGYVPGS